MATPLSAVVRPMATRMVASRLAPPLPLNAAVVALTTAAMATMEISWVVVTCPGMPLRNAVTIGSTPAVTSMVAAMGASSGSNSPRASSAPLPRAMAMAISAHRNPVPAIRPANRRMGNPCGND
ncbi:MAG: hypothetical protein QM702_10575 [Rubrivivax sp.]